MSVLKPRPGEAALALHFAELLSLADVHDRLAGESIRCGKHDAHDLHKYRAFELRKLAALARATVVAQVVN